MAEPAHKNSKNPPGQVVNREFDRYQWLKKPQNDPSEAPKEDREGVGSPLPESQLKKAYSIGYAKGWADAMQQAQKDFSEKA